MTAAGRGPRLLAVHGAQGGVGWELVAANGRRLATGVRRYRTERELESAVRQLLADRAALRWAVSQDGGRLWGWTAYLPVRSTRQGLGEGEPIARSARGYLRRDQCRQNIDGFREGIEQVQRELRRFGWPGRSGG